MEFDRAESELGAGLELLEPAVVERVVDGDTLLVRMGESGCGARERVRLIGIDAAESVAPEEWRNCAQGRRAADVLEALAPAGTRVWLQRDVSDVDQYGRLLRYVWLAVPERACEVGDIRAWMLNARLVECGAAAAQSYPPDTGLDLLFEGIEEARGL